MGGFFLLVELHRKGSSPACLLADWLAILAVRSIVQPGNKESGLQRVASFAKILSPYLYTSGVAVVKSSAQAPGQLDSDPPTVEDLDYAAELLARVQYIYRSGLSLLIPSSKYRHGQSMSWHVTSCHVMARHFV